MQSMSSRLVMSLCADCGFGCDRLCMFITHSLLSVFLCELVLSVGCSDALRAVDQVNIYHNPALFVPGAKSKPITMPRFRCTFQRVVRRVQYWYDPRSILIMVWFRLVVRSFAYIAHLYYVYACTCIHWNFHHQLSSCLFDCV
jgi:hypothetical protein